MSIQKILRNSCPEIMADSRFSKSNVVRDLIQVQGIDLDRYNKNKAKYKIKLRTIQARIKLRNLLKESTIN